jgi:hypothetical protein
MAELKLFVETGSTRNIILYKPKTQSVKRLNSKGITRNEATGLKTTAQN